MDSKIRVLVLSTLATECCLQLQTIITVQTEHWGMLNIILGAYKFQVILPSTRVTTTKSPDKAKCLLEKEGECVRD